MIHIGTTPSSGPGELARLNQRSTHVRRLKLLCRERSTRRKTVKGGKALTTPFRSHHGLFTQLMRISRQACSAQAYEVAYHALFAAMHCAVQLNDVALLEEVLQEADCEHQQLDTAHPEHLLSSASAATCGHESRYSVLEGEITINIQLLETKGLFAATTSQQRAP
jgi:hypothetical protein